MIRHSASLPVRRIAIAACFSTLAASAAFADDIPHRKPGLWETTMNSPQMQGKNVTAQQCIDEKTDAEMLNRGMNNGAKDTHCSQRSFKRTGSGFQFDSVCEQGDGTITTHGVLTGDFNSQYTMDVTGHRTPATNGRGEFQTTLTARYLGACSADMKPGDMKINGMLINVNGMPANMSPQQQEQMRKMMEQMKKQRQQ